MCDCADHWLLETVRPGNYKILDLHCLGSWETTLVTFKLSFGFDHETCMVPCDYMCRLKQYAIWLWVVSRNKSSACQGGLQRGGTEAERMEGCQTVWTVTMEPRQGPLVERCSFKTLGQHRSLYWTCWLWVIRVGSISVLGCQFGVEMVTGSETQWDKDRPTELGMSLGLSKIWRRGCAILIWWGRHGAIRLSTGRREDDEINFKIHVPWQVSINIKNCQLSCPKDRYWSWYIDNPCK